VRDANAIISALAENPARSALLCDYDGSLAPIVERAEDAQPLPDAVEVLERLSGQLGLVGIVSGRPIEFLASHVPMADVVLVGLYGMQLRVDGETRVDPRVEPHLPSIALAEHELRAQFPTELVERKSGVAITLHWRPQPELASAMVAAADDVAARHGLGQLRTRMAVELRPPIAIDKGEVVRELVEGFDVALFAGDDTGDLPAFDALADAGLQQAIRIGVRSDEMPPDLVDHVDAFVDGPRGLVDLLTRVSEQVV
jgi:trehalose 6-phosphate phosphatase